MPALMPGPAGSDPAQDLKRIDALDRFEEAGRHGELPDLVGRTPAVFRIRKNVVDRQNAARRHVRRPGPVIAERIVEYREAHGPFTSIDQLQNVSGIGPSKYDAIRELVVTE